MLPIASTLPVRALPACTVYAFTAEQKNEYAYIVKPAIPEYLSIILIWGISWYFRACSMTSFSYRIVETYFGFTVSEKGSTHLIVECGGGSQKMRKRAFCSSLKEFLFLVQFVYSNF